MDSADISSWMGRPPVTRSSKHIPMSTIESSARSVTSPAAHNYLPSDSSSDVLQVDVDRLPPQLSPYSAPDSRQKSSASKPSATSVRSAASRPLRINVPVLPPKEKAKFGVLPGHFEIVEVITKEADGGLYVRLQSTETERLLPQDLDNFDNSEAALADYEHIPRTRRAIRVPALDGLVNWDNLHLSDSDSDLAQFMNRKRRKLSDVSNEDVATMDEFEETDSASESPPVGRRSMRIAGTKATRQAMNELVELTDSESDQSVRRTRRKAQQTVRKSATGKRQSSGEPARRSSRTRALPRRSMRERHEDEISSASEQEHGPKIITTKEVFEKVSPDNTFRKHHRQDCDTCKYSGDIPSKGPLVFCQGCTNSYHKNCLGPRGSRDHLVTKVGDARFVLQCRRCIGTAHKKDALAPHQGYCSACNEPGPLTKPFRAHLTTRQEQLQREENGGVDLVTHVDKSLLNNHETIMFRCAQCMRSWHMHHLPSRQTIAMQDDDEGLLTQEQLAQKRFEYYHRSWTCKDCVENQHQIDAIVAWRPVDIEGYMPGTTVDVLPESQKEYLIKWRNQSYLRVTWMPGSWVWGIAAITMKTSFIKKPENAIPKMTSKDALPEEFFRVDIVFDVRYTSVVRNSSKEIDMVRAKEVESAYVKYKGLGFEDAIWEKPPTYNDTERWEDFKTAYEDYVLKVYMAIPPQSTLRRHLTNIRTQNFETLARKSQPSMMVGGELMKYQLEGLNWLYWQWFRGHNAVLADEMGLGKTIQLIAFMANLVQEHKCWPFLIVVPNSTCPNWRREIKKWAPSLRAVAYYGSERARRLTHDFELFPEDKDKEAKKESSQSNKRRSEVKDIKAHIVITSYESIIEEKTRRSLVRVPWQCLIVDEGQRLKNDKNLIYEGLSKFNFPFKVLLTGTPLQNNARELFNLLQFLDRTKNAAELEAKYAQLTQENVPELHEMLRPFFLRRTKVQVLTFLPPMAQIIVPVTMSTVQRRVYKSILAQNPHLMKSIFAREGTLAQKDRVNLNNILMQLRKTLCHPFVYSREIEERTSDQEAAHRGLVEASAKLQLLQIMLPKLQERGHRVLLFSQFLDNLDVMEDFLDGMGMLHRRLDGTINALEKQKRIDEYNAPESPYFAFLLSTRAGGVGINLATADTVIILDPDFNPHQDIQALSRAHRIGQKHKVLVFQLVTKGSAEEKIMAIGKKKMALDHILIERMDQEDDAGDNLESILKFGAEALFKDQKEDDKIVYDSASIDKLLDRSQIESTKISDTQSAESQFGYARVWANDTFEDGLGEEETQPPDPDIWDKILEEREKAYEEEQARKAETLGRGKRRRGAVDYNSNSAGDQGNDAINASDDNDFAMSADDGAPSHSSSSESEAPEPPRSTRGHAFKRVKVPVGPAPYFNGDGTLDHVPVGPLPPVHRCTACNEEHSIGWCRLKIAGPEHCGLCGVAHMGHGRTCPHLNDERQVDILLATLKESTEPSAIVDDARKYLTLIRSNLVSQRKKREADAKALQEAKWRLDRAGTGSAASPLPAMHVHPRFGMPMTPVPPATTGQGNLSGLLRTPATTSPYTPAPVPVPVSAYQPAASHQAFVPAPAPGAQAHQSTSGKKPGRPKGT